MRRYRGPGLLLLLVLMTAGLLLAQQDDDDARPDDLTLDAQAEGRKRPSALLAAEAASDVSPAQPGLSTRSATDGSSKDAPHGPVTVHVRGPDGTPLAGVFVGYLPSHKFLLPHVVSTLNPLSELCLDGALETDADGKAVVRDLPYDGSFAVRAYPTKPPVGSPNLDVLPLTLAAGRAGGALVLGERVVLHAGVGHWLTVSVVDATRGTPIGTAEVVVSDAHATRSAPNRATAHRVLLAWGKSVAVPLQVKAPEGWVAWEPSKWTAHVSPYAKRLAAIYPLRREIPLSISVLEPNRSPVTSPEIVRVEVAGRHIPRPALDVDAYDRLHLRGVPFLPGEEVRCQARRRGGVVTRSSSARIGGDPAQRLLLEIMLPPKPLDGIGIGGGAGGAFRGRGGRRTLGVSGGGGRSRSPPRGSVTIRVRRHGGGPAAGAQVSLGSRTGRTNVNGRVQFRHVRPGTYAVKVRQVGLLPMLGEVTVRGVEAARLILTESKGGRLLIDVVDERGRPLPFATLTITPTSKQPWVDVDEDGTQRLDPYTDHRGRRLLRHLESGQVRIKASWGSRAATTSVAVVEDGSASLRIVLPRPKGP